MRDHDQQFFDSFMLVLGLLLGLTVALFFVARFIAHNTQGVFELDDPVFQRQIDARIAPIGHVVLLGDKELEEQQAAAAALPQPAASKLTGEQVFNMVCYACHAPPGAGGAPVIGDPAEWDARVAKGLETLEDHALHGYQGEKGFMPPKGGRVDLSDEVVIEAVKYIVSKDPNAPAQ